MEAPAAASTGAVRRRGAVYFELLVTFGLFALPFLLNSVHGFLTGTPSSRHPLTIVAFVVQELLLIGLFFYVLRAHGERFTDLARLPERRDVRRTLLLGLVVHVAYVAGGLALWRWTSLVDPVAETALRARFASAPLVPLFVLLLVNPFCEELWMRVFLQTRLELLGWPVWTIVAASAGVQAGYHLYQGVGRTLLYVVVFGLFAAYFQRTRRVAPIIALHLLTDVMAGIAMTHGR